MNRFHWCKHSFQGEFQVTNLINTEFQEEIHKWALESQRERILQDPKA